MTAADAAALPDQWADIAGVRTRYLSAGPRDSAATIVFIHGGLFADNGFCANACAWELNLPALGTDFRVLAFDALGHGRTGVPTQDADDSFDGLIRHLQGFLSEMGVRRAHLVGHDEGGLAAINLAVASPALVASCTVVDSPTVAPIGDSDTNLTLVGHPAPRYGARSQRWVLERQSFTPHHISLGRYLDEAVAIAESREFQNRWRRLAEDAALARQIRRSLNKMRTDSFARYANPGVPVPVQLIWGHQDRMSPVPFAQSLFELMAQGQKVTQLRVINQAGYLPFREQASVFNAMLAGFVRALS